MILSRGIFIFAIAFLISVTSPLRAQDALRSEIMNIVRGVKADVGVGIKYIERGDTLNVRGHGHFPMQSVYKFHLALAVLNKVDKGKLTLDQKIYISKDDMHAGTWSPIAKKYPEGNVSLSIRELVTYAVAQSDNNACDVLFRLVGGPAYVDTFIRSFGVKEFSIVSTETEMAADWNLQFKNWSSPVAMTELLDVFFHRKILAYGTHNFLLDIMEGTITGNQRIKGLLPKGTVVQHKTGTGAPDDQGVLSALNDVGFIILPGGEHAAITFFITNATEEPKALEEVIAKISKLVYEN